MTGKQRSRNWYGGRMVVLNGKTITRVLRPYQYQFLERRFLYETKTTFQQGV